MSDTGAINIRHTDATIGSLPWARERYSPTATTLEGKLMPETATSLLDQQKALIEQLQTECLDESTIEIRRDLLEQLATAFNGYSTLKHLGE